MAMTVRTNTSSMSAAAELGRTNQRLSSTLERIASGLRINSAADDAAGLAVATNLQSAVMSTQQAIRNANDGISIIQTAESSTEEVTNMLQRMRELAVQGSSETLHNDERSYLQEEFNQLRSEISRIANATEFNGVNLNDGSTTGLSVQVGINNDSISRISITLGDLRATSLGMTSAVGVATTTSAQSALDTIDVALDSVSSFRADLGAVQNRIDSSINNAMIYVEALSAAESRIRDADYAEETSEMTKYQIMQQAGVAALAQAKNINQSVISLLS